MFKIIIGFLAAGLTTIAFVPQAFKTWKSRSTDDLSPIMFALFCIGITCWFIYGIILKDIFIITANIISVSLAISIMYFIFKQKHTRKISHIAIWVNDIENLKNFYCSNLNGIAGERYVNHQKDFCSYFISFTSGSQLELLSSLSGTGFVNANPKPHFAFSVGSKKEVNRLTAVLLNKGVEIINNPRITGDGYYENTLTDPEGNIIELTV